MVIAIGPLLAIVVIQRRRCSRIGGATFLSLVVVVITAGEGQSQVMTDGTSFIRNATSQ